MGSFNERRERGKKGKSGEKIRKKRRERKEKRFSLTPFCQTVTTSKSLHGNSHITVTMSSVLFVVYRSLQIVLAPKSEYFTH